MQPVHRTVGAVRAGTRDRREPPRTSRPFRRPAAVAALIPALVLGALGLTSCASRSGSPAPSSHAPGAARPTSVVQSAPARPSRPRPDVADAPACTTGGIAASLSAGRQVGGYRYASIDLVNTGDTACVLTADVTVVPLNSTSARMAVPQGWANSARLDHVPLSPHGVARYGTATPTTDSWAEIVLGGAASDPLAPAGSACTADDVTPAFWQVTVGAARFDVTNRTSAGPLQACGPRWTDLVTYAQG